MITTITQIDSAFDYMFQKVTDTLSDDDIRDIVSTFLNKMGYQPISYEIYFPAFFRARKVTDHSVDQVTSEILLNKKNFSYPPAGMGLSGRCNLKGYPVLYGSTDSGVALFEVRPEVGDFVAISEFHNQSATENRIPVIAIGVKAIIESLAKRNQNDTMARLLATVLYLKTPLRNCSILTSVCLIGLQRLSMLLIT